jgi:transcriptional regulator with XRE-family HTH domain
MSDLYLVLRHRLDAVQEWVYLSTADLKAARKRTGLSYESMARQVPTTAKTWERWEKAGRIPRHTLPRVAEVLGLEIEQPEVAPISVRPGPDAESGTSAGQLLVEIRGLRRDLRPLLALVEDLQEDRAREQQETHPAP